MNGDPQSFAPAEVFHASELIADEAIARDWSIWDFVERIGTLNPPRDVLAWRIYAASASMEDPRCRMGDDAAMGLERVFGISAEFWRRTEALCFAYPDRVAPLSDHVNDWHEFADEPTPVSSPPSSEA